MGPRRSGSTVWKYCPYPICRGRTYWQEQNEFIARGKKKRRRKKNRDYCGEKDLWNPIIFNIIQWENGSTEESSHRLKVWFLSNMQRKNILTRARRVHSQREKEKKKEKGRKCCGEKYLQTISNNLQYNSVGQWIHGWVVPPTCRGRKTYWQEQHEFIARGKKKRRRKKAESSAERRIFCSEIW